MKALYACACLSVCAVHVTQATTVFQMDLKVLNHSHKIYLFLCLLYFHHLLEHKTHFVAFERFKESTFNPFRDLFSDGRQKPFHRFVLPECISFPLIINTRTLHLITKSTLNSEQACLMIW